MAATAYCGLSDLDYYCGSFLLDFYGTMLGGSTGTVFAAGSTSAVSDVRHAFRRLNERLDAMPRITTVPVGTDTETGRYPEALAEWNAKTVIWERLYSRHVQEDVRGEIPDWMSMYKTDIERIETDVNEGNIVFRADTSLGERGIQPPSIATKTGVATFYNNWDRGEPYEDDEYPRTFVVEIDGTSEGNDIGDATFKWSLDAGVTWEEEDLDTSTSWVSLHWNCKIRWSPDTGTGNQLEAGDRWTWRCVPLETTAFGRGDTAKMRSFWRGW